MYNVKSKILIFGTLAIILSACGYKPAASMIKNLFTESVYVEVKVDRVEPENAPFVKDEMNRLVYTRFKSRVVDKEHAESTIEMSYRGTTFRALAYENGYVTRYRADIHVNFVMKTKEGILKKRISARHEADIQASSLISSTLRTEAIRKGLEKALDQFMAYVSVKGMISNRNDKDIK